MPIKVLASKHPIIDDWLEAEVADGQTIREIVGDAPVHAWVNGHAIPAELLAHTRPKPGTQLVVRPVPQGDSRLLAQIGVQVAALFAYAIPGIGPAVSAAIQIGGNLAINAFLPPQMPNMNRDAESFNRLAAFTGTQNKVAAFVPIPRLYGEMRFFPPIPMTAPPYTELQGSDQYLRMMVCLGYGPLQIGGVQAGNGALITEATSLTGTPIRIGDTSIDQFDDVEFEIGDASAITLFSNEIIETVPAWVVQADVSGIDTNSDGRWITDNVSAVRTTDTDASEISIDVTFANGLFSISKKGKTTNAKVEFRIEYRAVGTSTWTTVINPWTLSSAKRETFRAARRWKVAKGQYEVRLTRIRTYHADFEGVADESTWTALRTIRSKRPFIVPNIVVMALRIRATDQLNGKIDNLSVEATSMLSVWNGSSWVLQATRTPAWIYTDILTGTANGDPLNKNQLDTAALLDWATTTNTDNRYYDSVFDDNATVFDRIQEVTLTGRAVWSLTDTGLMSVVRDDPNATTKMVISQRNAYDFSSTILFNKPPHAYRVRFTDPNTYEDTERLVFDDGYNSSNATLFEVLQTKGVKSADIAWKDGRYYLAQQRLRPEIFNFSQDVQYLRYRRGDRLALNYDVIEVGLGSGWVKNVTENLLLHSEDFSNAAWTLAGLTVTTNATTAPDGTLTADKLVSNSFTGRISARQFVTVTPNQTVAQSVYAKAAEWNWVTIFLDSANVAEGTYLGSGAKVNLLTGVSTVPSLVSTQSAGNGWWRLTIAGTYTTSSATYEIAPLNSNLASVNTTVGDGTSGIYVWGAQLEEGSVATPYIRTEDTIGVVFESDETLFMEPGKSYGVTIQKSDGTVATSGITTVSPSTQLVTLTSLVEDVEAGNHFIFGELGEEYIDVKVSAIQPAETFTARVTCVPAALNILDAETGAIPDYDAVLTQPIDVNSLPPPVPTILSLRSDESVLLRDTDGSMRVRLVVATDISAFPGSGTMVQARYRDTEDTTTWSISERGDRGIVSITDVDQGRAYDIQVRSLRGEKVSAWSAAQQHTIIGKSSLPQAVEGFLAHAARDRIELSWDANVELDISHYIVREGTSWETGTLIVQTDGTKYQSREPSNGPWWVKAVDTSGNESASATQAAISPVLPSVDNITGQVVDNNVLLRWTSTVGTFDIQTYEVRKGADAATADLVGNSDKTFDVVFETASGTYTYWIVPVDAAHNEGDSQSITLSVDSPPDFLLRNSFQTDWEGYTADNVQPLFSVPLPSRLTVRDQTALEFDGVDDYVEVGNASVFNPGTQSFVVEALFQTTAVGFRDMLGKGDASPFPGWLLRVDDQGRVQYRISDGTNSASLQVTGYNDGRFHHAAGVTDRTAQQIRLYLDGVLVSSTSCSSVGSVSAVSDLRLGRNWEGRLAELRYWLGVVRTQAQINDWKDRTLDGNEAGLTGYWRVQGGSGDTIADKSGNGNDGAVVGASWHVPTVRAAIPFPSDETVAQRSSVHGYATPQAQIDAGYPYVAQPVPTTATFEEVYDAGVLIPSTKVNVTLASTDVVAGVTSEITLSTRQNEGDAWTNHPAGQTQVFATNFRYVKVKVVYTSDGSAFLDEQDIKTVLSTKIRNDSGRVSVASNPTTVNLNVDFVDVESITATPQGTTAKLAMVDFDDVPNPTQFDVYLFNADGTPATGDVRWSARGF